MTVYQVKETTRTLEDGRIEKGYCLVDETGTVHPQYDFDSEYERTFATCQQFNTPIEYDENLFSWWIEENEKVETGTQEPVPAAEPVETIGLDEKHEVGEVVEVEGASYIVEQVFHISEQDALFADEVGDMQIAPGWHANARRRR